MAHSASSLSNVYPFSFLTKRILVFVQGGMCPTVKLYFSTSLIARVVHMAARNGSSLKAMLFR